jgi:hypothetical protein
LDRDDEGGGSPSPEVLVSELAAEEDPILDGEGRDLAGADAKEGDRRRVWNGLLEADVRGLVSGRDRQVRREREPLP